MLSLAAFLLILLLSRSKANLFCPHYEISAKEGESALLPCPFSYTMVPQTESWKVSWLKQLKEEDALSVYMKNGREEGYQQSEVYVGRTRLRRDWILHGDATLELYDVTSEDTGEYTCWVTQLLNEHRPNNTCVHVTLHMHLMTVKKSCSCPHEMVTAPLGGTVTFKCPITWEPGETKKWQVSWLKKLKSEGEVQVHCQNGGDEEVTQNEDYIGRTSLCENWVKNVNGALTLTNVKISDAGDYICFVTHLAEDIKRTMCCEVALKVESENVSDEEGCSCKSNLSYQEKK